MQLSIIRFGLFMFTLTCVLYNRIDETIQFIISIYDFGGITTKTYDFIIVGAGSAGCVLASRLSENENIEVLLLESGGHPYFPPVGNIPLMTNALQQTPYVQEYLTVPQKHACEGLHERRSLWRHGRGLGGSSSINYMMYFRGHREDFDNWAQKGNHGWSYEDVLPYFEKSLNKEYDGKYEELHQRDWPIQLSLSLLSHRPFESAFLQAGELLGYKSYRHLNTTQEEGFWSVPVTQRSGARCSSYFGFLRPALIRPNLHIMTRTQVHKILIDENNIAYGVQVNRFGRILKLRSRKEVILSSGAVSSPKLLMLSGIGPADHLKSLKIPVVANLSVGENLQDHYGTLVFPFIINKTVSFFPKRDISLVGMWDYFTRGEGILTSSLVQGSAFVKSSLKDMHWPDIQILFIPLAMSNFASKGLLGLNVRKDLIDHMFGPHEGRDAFNFHAIIGRPKSRGRLWLADTDPTKEPLIDPNYFSHPEDMDIVLVVRTAPFQDIGANLPVSPIPGCEHFTMPSRRYWECYARHLTITAYHPVGTCKMGPKSEETAVVDPHLRVHGVSGLRVVDGSVMPTLVNANLNAAIIMIAEKAADMIVDEWRLKWTPFPAGVGLGSGKEHKNEL